MDKRHVANIILWKLMSIMNKELVEITAEDKVSYAIIETDTNRHGVERYIKNKLCISLADQIMKKIPMESRRNDEKYYYKYSVSCWLITNKEGNDEDKIVS